LGDDRLMTIGTGRLLRMALGRLRCTALGRLLRIAPDTAYGMTIGLMRRQALENYGF